MHIFATDRSFNFFPVYFAPNFEAPCILKTINHFLIPMIISDEIYFINFKFKVLLHKDYFLRLTFHPSFHNFLNLIIAAVLLHAFLMLFLIGISYVVLKMNY